MSNIFRNDSGIKNLFGDGAFKRLVSLVSDCCSTGDGAQLITIPPDNYSFTPNARKLYLQYNTELTGDVDLTVDVSNCELGDVLIVFAKTGGSSVAINLNSDFFYTECSGDQTAINIDADSRIATYFTFDGEKYCSTYDNC
jgi:hypothetical protein